jgi:hypothetical protein
MWWMKVGLEADIDGGSNVTQRTPWIVDIVRHTFEAIVDAYAWGFGQSNARFVVGSLAITILVLITLLTAFCAFREVGAIGMKLIKLMFTLALALFLGSLVIPTYEYVFPTEAERLEAETVARHATEAAKSWALSQWWKRLV